LHLILNVCGRVPHETNKRIMAVRIRLFRRGRKKLALYDIVVADARAPRDGKFIEKLGNYNPNTDPATIVLNTESAFNWVMNGAQPSDTARTILSKKGVMFKKHLQIGVNKGAITQEAADKKYEEWLKGKEAQTDAQIKTIEDAKAVDSKARFAAETKVKEARAETLLKKQSEMIAAEEAAAKKAETEAAGEDGDTDETPAEEATEAKAEETPTEEKAPAEEAKEEATPEAKVEEATEEAPAQETVAEPSEAKEEAASEEKAEEVPAEEAPVKETVAEPAEAEEPVAEPVEAKAEETTTEEKSEDPVAEPVEAKAEDEAPVEEVKDEEASDAPAGSKEEDKKD